MKKKILSVLLGFCLSIPFFSITASAAGAIDVEGGVAGTDYTCSGGVFTVETSTPLTLSSTATSDQIVIASGVTANITFNSVNISSTSNPVSLRSGSILNLALAGGSANTMVSEVLQQNFLTGYVVI